MLYASTDEAERMNADFDKLLKGEISEIVIGESSHYVLVVTLRRKA